MLIPLDDWIAKARAVPIEQEVGRRGIKLRGRVERVGACPVCGGDDRFSINTKKRVWNCRGCDRGGDVIALVQHLDGVDFKGACAILNGESSRKPNGGNGAERVTEKPSKKMVAEKRTLVAAYEYQDADGKLVFVVERIEYQNADGSAVINEDGKHKKTFRQKRPDPDKPGAWLFNVDGVAPIPYRLPELIEALALGSAVLIVEGEAKVDLLWSWKVPATCCAGGAKKWRVEHAAYLKDADVVIVPDNDEPGRDHVNVVAGSLQNIAKKIRVLPLPGLPPKGDIVDWAKAGGTVEQLYDLIGAAPHWLPPVDKAPDTDADAPRPSQGVPGTAYALGRSGYGLCTVYFRGTCAHSIRVWDGGRLFRKRD
jgi:hypothetical protein